MTDRTGGRSGDVFLRWRRVLVVLSLGVLAALSGASLGEGALHISTDTEGTLRVADAPSAREIRVPPALGLPPDVDVWRGQYADLISRLATEGGVDPDLVRAIIKVESNFDAYAVSRKGARGLMQLMPGTAARYAVGDLHSPEDNIRGGVRYLRFLQDMFPGRMPLVLAAYNAGEHAVLRHNGIPPYRETRQYVDRVLSRYGHHAPNAGAPGSQLLPPPAGPKEPQATPPVPGIFRVVDGDGNAHYTNLPPPAHPPSGSAQ